MAIKEMSARQKKEWKAWEESCKRIREQDGPPVGESASARAVRIKRLLQPEYFEEFARYYFPAYASAPMAWFHKEAWHDVLVARERSNIWEWPRESAKSVFADVFLVCHSLFTGWLQGFILASETDPKACTLLKDVQAQLMHNPRILADFGDFGITGTWLQGYFSTKDGVGFWGFGIGQNPAGTRQGHRRPNLGIVDDADSYSKANNQKLTRARADWVLGEFRGCLATLDSIFIYANNRVHKEGLTAHIAGDIEEGQPLRKGYKRIKVYFTEDPVTHEMKLIEDGGVPAWRERFSVADCQRKIEEMGYRNAMRQLYHLHLQDGGRYTEDMLPWVDPIPLQEYDALCTYCDPAFGESGKACFRAIVLVGRAANQFHILYAWVRQTTSFSAAHYQLYKRIKNRPHSFLAKASDKEVSDGLEIDIPTAPNQYGIKWREKVNCEHWIESNDLQKILLNRIFVDDNNAREEQWYPRFDMEKKAEKIGRIESMEPLAERGLLCFSIVMRGDKDMITLRDQFLGFPDGAIDGPDAVQGALEKLNRKIASKTFKPRTGNYTRKTNRRA